MRVFPPPESFAQAAHIKSLGEYRALYEASLSDPEGFWAEQAEALRWSKKWDHVLEWNPPFAKWFVGGTLNLSENCLDRHVDHLAARTRPPSSGKGEPGETRTLTYQELHARGRASSPTCSRRSGVKKGDRVAHLHADDPGGGDRHAGLRPHRRHAHASSSAASAPKRSRDRINDAEAKLIITADGG